MLGEATISTVAISANAALLAAHDRDYKADLSYDGYGHGASEIAAAARAGGVRRFTAASNRDAAELRSAGFDVEHGRPSRALELYGLGDDTAFQQAMTVAAPVIGTKDVEPGDGVSYGYTFRASVHSTLALVGIGYADGLDRIASNRGFLFLGDEFRPIVGRVAMNVLMVDLGDGDCRLGDKAMVIGSGRTASQWASQIGRLAPEVVIEFGSKLRRVWA
jgi:alanine racemase